MEFPNEILQKIFFFTGEEPLFLARVCWLWRMNSPQSYNKARIFSSPRYLKELFQGSKGEWLLEKVVEHGTPETLNWLLSNLPSLKLLETLPLLALRRGNLPMLAHLLLLGVKSTKLQTPGALLLAVKSGNEDLVELLLGEGAPPTAEACGEVAVQGNLYLLILLWKKGAPWDHRVCLGAVLRGDLDLLIWATQKGAPRSVTAIYAAFGHQRKEILDWMQRVNWHPEVHLLVRMHLQNTGGISFLFP